LVPVMPEILWSMVLMTVETPHLSAPLPFSVFNCHI